MRRACATYHTAVLATWNRVDLKSVLECGITTVDEVRLFSTNAGNYTHKRVSERNPGWVEGGRAE